ncbi:MAG: NADH-quinone oxidoreductase subunit J [Planctomycetes bacterium]|nr:NADH-quinone oxidoreductase subunit J [Planctomycetota bacterium]
MLLLAIPVISSTAFGADLPEGVAPADVTRAVAPGDWVEVLLFYGAAAITVICALGVCVSRNIVRMAAWLFGALGGGAMLYFMLAANFIAAVQLIVYVGGTLILLIFGVMLTNKSPWVRFQPRVWELAGAGIVCVVLLASLITVVCRAAWHEVEGAVAGPAIADIGRILITKYLVPFEVAGVLLMIVMVGAAHLARQEKK